MAGALIPPGLAPEHGHADLGAVRLHYAAAGRGEPVILLHGFPEFWYAWRHVMADLARDHRVVAPDMRGYNLSSRPADVEAYRVRYLVADVLGLADHLGFPRFSLAGHDWGGVVAWAVAIQRPERLRRLVIVNAPHPAVFARELRDNPAQQRASRYMLLFRSAEAEATLSANDHALLADVVLRPGLEQGYFTETDRQAYLAAWARPGALTGGLNYYRAARVGPPAADGAWEPPLLVEGVPRVEVPTLVVWGERDTALLTGNLDGLEQHVRDLTVERVPGGTHWVIHEQPALVAAHVRRFLARA